MRVKKVLLFFSLFIVTSFYAQTFPGGVSGAELWYIVDEIDASNGTFLNSALTPVSVTPCQNFDFGLFNFNDSFQTENLCLSYKVSLENSSGRNIFFVGEPIAYEQPFSHVSTLWDSSLQNINVIQTDSIIRNFVDLNDKNVYNSSVYDDYVSNKNAHVNFYHFGNYDIDKKFKSYGKVGETTFYIGKPTVFDPDSDYDDNYFKGNFPEYISFPRELTSNERIRVESYLALKYGLTLASDVSYVNSRNLVFWDRENNRFFPDNIFGIGKDHISGLDQLQSESTHLKNHLVAAVGPIMTHNKEKQQTEEIADNNFIVFGNNHRGRTILSNLNDKGIRFWSKVWLSQVTGEKAPDISMHFNLFLTPQIIQTLQSNPSFTLWMLQDKLANNQALSDFNNESILYTEAASIDLNNGIAYFKDIHFDTPDKTKYDQFTFGVGSKIIIEYVTDCSGRRTNIKITGGRGPYHLVIQPQGGEPIATTIPGNEYYFTSTPGISYNVTVTDTNNTTSTINFLVESVGLNVDLGPDQELTPSQPSITLDVDQGTVDPDATYVWWFGSDVISNQSSITITEPGTYYVKVFSKDGGCEDKDQITITYAGFQATYSPIAGCDREYNTLDINIQGGFSPFVTNISGNGVNVNYAHSASTVISDIAFGSYTVTTTDANGTTYTENITFLPDSDPIVIDLFSQMDAICNNCFMNNTPSTGDTFFDNPPENDFTLDASLGISASQPLTYEWFLNDISTGVYTPEVYFTYGTECNGKRGEFMKYTVVITDPLKGCKYNQTFYISDYCIGAIASAAKAGAIENNQELSKVFTPLYTKVYPNPATMGNRFYYEVYSDIIFDGTIQLYSVSGALISTIEVKNESHYTLPLSLNSSGLYLIKITTAQGTKIDRLIIK